MAQEDDCPKKPPLANLETLLHEDIRVNDERPSFLAIGRDPQTMELNQLHHTDAALITKSDADSPTSRFEMEGRAPQNEEDTQEVAITLADALSKLQKRRWVADGHKPEREEGFDWFLRCDNRILPIQVTRAVDQSRWDTLGATRQVAGDVSAEQGAAEIWVAINRKLQTQDSKAVLAVNVRHPGFHLFPSILAAFEQTYGPMLPGLIQFKEIWVVGYEPELCRCIYRRDETS
jgi:hypothetical protein